MNLGEALISALRGLRTHRLRSALTMLGLIIGVTAVIVLFACGQGVQSSVDARIEPVANLITIVPQAINVPGGPPALHLTDADAAALRDAPDIATVTPVITGSTSIASTTTTVLTANIIGSTPRWVQVNSRELQAGTFFDQSQAGSGARVVVLGPTVATALFGNPTAALGQTVRISHESFRVVGVMHSYGQQLDNTAVMPLRTARRYVVGYGFGAADQLNQILVQAPQQAAVPAAQDEVTGILDTRHHIEEPRLRDFQVQSLGRRLRTFNQILRILTLFTPAVAAVSLLVGGIGVLNIMLVSVSERTREIGIRKAVGATRGAIRKQFLIESSVLAGFGGVLGVASGVGLSLLGKLIAPALDPSSGAFTGFSPVVSVLPITVTLAITLLIGLVAGVYPAIRAARLHPIDALRYE